MSIAEFRYTKAANSKWRRTSVHLTLVDTAQRLVAVVDVDESAAVYAAASLRGPVGVMLGAVADLFAPDVLHATAVTEWDAENAGCIMDFVKWTGAQAAAVTAGLTWQAASIAANHAWVVAVAASAAAAADPALRPAALAADAAYAGAQAGSLAAFSAFVTATGLVTYTANELKNCMTNSATKPPGGGGGGGGVCDNGEEPICDWYMYVSDGKLYFGDEGCYCEDVWEM